MSNDLRHLDETSENLLKRGHVKEAIDCMELTLQKRQNLFGQDSHAYKLSSSNTASKFAQIAISSFYNFKNESRIKLLLRADYLNKSDDSSRVMIWYHLALLFQSSGNTKEAVRLLKKSLAYPSMITLRTVYDRSLCIDIHLSMSSILSLLKRHEMSLRHSRIALKLIERIIVTEEETNIEELDGTHGKMSNYSSRLNHLDRRWLEILAIAYYNVGAQYEHLRDFRASCCAYEYGLKAASLLSDTHGIRRKLEIAFKFSRDKNEIKM